MSKGKKIIFGVLSLLAVISVGGTVFLTKLGLDLKDSIESTHVEPERKHKSKERVIEATKPFSILLMGIDAGGVNREDSGKWQARADSTMLVVVNPKNKQTTVLSISRDLLVKLEGPSSNKHTGESDKLGHMFAFGGPGMSMDTVSALLDIPINYYVALNMNGLSELVNALGGLKVDANFGTFNGEPLTEVMVPDELATLKSMVKSDEVLSAVEAAQNGYESIAGIFQKIKAGKQKMDGRTALNYARYRHGDEGEVGRQKRQREIIQLILNRLISINSLCKYEKILDVMKDNMKTNLTWKNMVDIQKSYSSSTLKNVLPLQLQGEAYNPTGEGYYQLVSKELLLKAQNYMCSQMDLPESIQIKGSNLRNTYEKITGKKGSENFFLGTPDEKEETTKSTGTSDHS
ncbi:MAG: LCP family protein [Lactobacillales bacterium]|jgi:LCP family protein required for cell wall assembly|nr:LCP family protein [Lactobacillales bacterium]